MTSKRLAALLLTTSLLLAACNGADEGEAATQSTPAQTAEAVRSVRTVTAKSGPLEATRSASVTVEPLQESRVAALSSGRVEQILKREGEAVEAGDPVIILDSSSLDLQARNARLALEAARINLQKAQRSSGESTTQLDQQLSSARTSFNLAQRQYEEGQSLFSAGGISSTELSGLEAQFSSAQANLTAAQDAFARSQRAGSEDLALLRVQVDQAQTQLSQALDALDESQIKAPFTGEVAEIFTEEGEFVAAGSPAFRVVSTERQLGRFSVPPSDAAQLARQDTLYFRYQGLDYGARIVRTSNAPGDSRLTDITAEIYPSEVQIPAGSVAQLSYTVPLGSGVQIPTSALGVQGGQNYVFVVEDGMTRRQTVSIGAEVSGQAVVEGLEDGAQVVSPLPADLRSGVQVRVVGVTDEGL